jgi:uncharacterized protein (DUF302 family)
MPGGGGLHPASQLKRVVLVGRRGQRLASEDVSKLRVGRGDMAMGSAGNGGRRIDKDAQQPRAEGHHERLEAQVKAKGMTIFARIDHAAGAAEVGLPLRPTELLIFGNAKGGTPLMQAEQAIGIDLPLKALVWQDEAGVTWLSYNDPTWLAKRHGLAGGTEAPARAMAAAMDGVARAAAGSP